MLTVKYPIVVEGKYDKIKLSSLVKAEIIQTDGFRIFSKKETMALLRRLAEKSKLIVTPPLSLLIPTFAFPDAPEYLTIRLQRRLECSPTDLIDLIASVVCLYPIIIHAPSLD